jgi:hypothetical protein
MVPCVNILIARGEMHPYIARYHEAYRQAPNKNKKLIYMKNHLVKGEEIVF